MPLGELRYEPGMTYPVVVTVSDPDETQTAAGFSISARSPDGCFQAGDFAVPADDAGGLQVANQGRSRPGAPCPASPLQFATHTMPHAMSDGAAAFAFEWTAPEANAGPIVFAAAGNAADGDEGRMGDRIYLASGTVLPAGLAITNGASFRGPGFSHEQIVSIFREGMTNRGGAAGNQPLTGLIAGVSATVTDSAGESRVMPLFSVMPDQLNGAIPGGTAEGLATVTLNPAGQAPESTPIQVGAVAPGIFSADGTGSGVAAAVALRLDGAGGEQQLAVFEMADGAIVPAGIDVASGGDVILLLFGTGIRGADTVEALINGESAPVVAWGPSSEFFALDQVNVRLSPELAGSGEATIHVTADGAPSNAVTVLID